MRPTSIPSARKHCVSVSPTSSSAAVSRWPLADENGRRAPMRARYWPSSQAVYPPPSTTTDSGNRLEVEHGIAVDVSGLLQPGKRPVRPRSRSRPRTRRLRAPVVAYGEFSRRKKPSFAPIEWKRFDPLDAIIGKLFNDLALTRCNEGDVYARRAGVNAQSPCRARVVQGVARGQKRLARHAASQNAEPSERASSTQRDVAAEIARRARGGVPAGARADDDEVVAMARYQRAPLASRAGARRDGGSNLIKRTVALECIEDRVRAGLVPEKPHAADEVAVGDAGRAEHDVLARYEIVDRPERDPGRRSPSPARARASSSLRGCSRPMKSPPRHLIAAAASTPSGAPPVPIATWMPVDSIAVAIARIYVAVGDQLESERPRRGPP